MDKVLKFTILNLESKVIAPRHLYINQCLIITSTAHIHKWMHPSKVQDTNETGRNSKNGCENSIIHPQHHLNDPVLRIKELTHPPPQLAQALPLRSPLGSYRRRRRHLRPAFPYYRACLPALARPTRQSRGITGIRDRRDAGYANGQRVDPAVVAVSDAAAAWLEMQMMQQ